MDVLDTVLQDSNTNSTSAKVELTLNLRHMYTFKSCHSLQIGLAPLLHKSLEGLVKIIAKALQQGILSTNFEYRGKFSISK